MCALPFTLTHLTSIICIKVSVSVHTNMCVHSLIWDDLEDQVVQQCELLSYLQGRVVLKWFSLTVLHGLAQKHNCFQRTRCNFKKF